MNNFIIGVLAALLMLAATYAGLTYLGPAFLNTSGKRDLAIYSTQALQINGAIHGYMAENGGGVPGGSNADIAASLISAGYLQDFPTGPWIMNEGAVFRQLKDLNQCVQINKAASVDMSDPLVVADNGCPPCDDLQHQMYPGCQRTKPTDPVYTPYDPSTP